MKSENSLVSVVIPCYNHEQFIQDSIQSVINQTYENIELIIIDDGSKDDSVLKIREMIESCEERFVRFEFRNRANIGLSATLNEALEWCQGKYFSPLASDDQMLNSKTAIQVSFLEKNIKIPALSAGVKLVDEDNKKIRKCEDENKFYTFKEIIMHEHYLPAPTQMIRTDILRKVGGYNSDLLIEDWYMWLKLSINGEIYYMSNILCLYRIHSSNTSKNLVKMQEGRLAVLNCFKENIYYEDAVKNIYWVNMVETYIGNKKIKYIIKLFIANPKKTVLISLKNLNNRVRKLLPIL